MFTGYFARLKIYKEQGLIPVAICGKSPDWYDGFQYKKLAPKWAFFKEWKDGAHKGDNAYYCKHFKEEVLDTLDVEMVKKELEQFGPLDKLILLCYEKTGDFCHRRLVADWFCGNGIGCIEFLTKQDLSNVIVDIMKNQTPSMFIGEKGNDT